MVRNYRSILGHVLSAGALAAGSPAVAADRSVDLGKDSTKPWWMNGGSNGAGSPIKSDPGQAVEPVVVTVTEPYNAQGIYGDYASVRVRRGDDYTANVQMRGDEVHAIIETAGHARIEAWAHREAGGAYVLDRARIGEAYYSSTGEPGHFDKVLRLGDSRYPSREVERYYDTSLDNEPAVSRARFQIIYEAIKAGGEAVLNARSAPQIPLDQAMANYEQPAYESSISTRSVPELGRYAQLNPSSAMPNGFREFKNVIGGADNFRIYQEVGFVTSTGSVVQANIRYQYDQNGRWIGVQAQGTIQGGSHSGATFYASGNPEQTNPFGYFNIGSSGGDIPPETGGASDVGPESLPQEIAALAVVARANNNPSNSRRLYQTVNTNIGTFDRKVDGLIDGFFDLLGRHHSGSRTPAISSTVAPTATSGSLPRPMGP